MRRARVHNVPVEPIPDVRLISHASTAGLSEIRERPWAHSGLECAPCTSVPGPGGPHDPEPCRESRGGARAPCGPSRAGGEDRLRGPPRHPLAGDALPARARRHGPRRYLAFPGALRGGAGSIAAAGGEGKRRRGSSNPSWRRHGRWCARARTASPRAAGSSPCSRPSWRRPARCRWRPSSLMQVPFVERLLPPGRRAGILTVSSVDLHPEHLVAAGVAADTPVVGTESGRELSRVLLGDLPELDVEAAQQDVLDAADTLVRSHPEGRRHRARMHQHDALRSRAQAPNGAVRVRHVQLRDLVPLRARAAPLSPRPRVSTGILLRTRRRPWGGETPRAPSGRYTGPFGGHTP